MSNQIQKYILANTKNNLKIMSFIPNEDNDIISLRKKIVDSIDNLLYLWNNKEHLFSKDLDELIINLQNITQNQHAFKQHSIPLYFVNLVLYKYNLILIELKKNFNLEQIIKEQKEKDGQNGNITKEDILS